MKGILLLLFTLYSISFLSFSNTKIHEIDSLTNILSTCSSKDSFNIYLNLSGAYHRINSDSCLLFAEKALKLAKNDNEKTARARKQNCISKTFSR